MSTEPSADGRPELCSVSDVKQLSLPVYRDFRGDLIPSGPDCLPSRLMRVFFVLGRDGAIRGEHAHKACAQTMVCLAGRVMVYCTDGRSEENFELDSPGQALLVPPTIWSSQVFFGQSPILAVLCDQEYDPEDYIRDWDAFLTFRGQA